MVRILYIFTLSPPARAVQMLAKHLGLSLEIKNLDFKKGEHLTPEFLKLNPTHTVPVLVEDDGYTVWESHTILIYLAEKYGKDDSLYPKDPKKRVVVHQKLFFETDIAFNRLAAVVRGFLRQTKTQLEQFDIDQFNELYSFLELFLSESTWLAGNNPTIADYSLLSTVSSTNLIVPIDAKKYPKLDAWLKKTDTLPGSSENKKGVEGFREIVKSFNL